MTTYVALLRGINVGGHKAVAMADLRGLLAELDFSDVRSLLNSGNLLFRAADQACGKLERRLEAESEKRLGLRTEFLVRTAQEWAAAIAHNPFVVEAERDPGHLLLMTLKDAPDAGAVAALQAAITGREAVRANGRHAYLVYPDGVGRSRLTHALIEKTLGTSGTARNWNTALKLAALAGV
jgi:uncharacterized protein (DUF1697 family)